MFRKRIAALVASLVFGLMVAHAWALAAPATPQPSDCTIAPIDIDDLQTLVAAGTPEAATPATPSAATTSANVSAGIAQTIEESVACTNANQPLRALALFTDRYLVARFSGKGADDLGHLVAAVTRAATPAAPADRLAIISKSDPSLLSDGRASVLVTTANSSQTFADVLVLEQVGGVWLIDETHTATPSSATPTSGG